MRILITNDDGFDSNGIAALVKELCSDNEIYVSAPAEQQSGKAHSISFFQDIEGQKAEYQGTVQAWKIWGSPADCAYVGALTIMDEKPDLLISGINAGPNLGLDDLYSGTIGAASEGIILGIPSIAVSLDSYKSTEIKDYEAAAKTVRNLIPGYLSDPECSQYVLSVNVPFIPLSEMKGYRITRFDSRRAYQRDLVMIDQDNGRTLFHSKSFSCSAEGERKEDDGDIAAVEDGYVSLTPVGLDLVDYSRCRHIEKWLSDIRLG